MKWKYTTQTAAVVLAAGMLAAGGLGPVTASAAGGGSKGDAASATVLQSADLVESDYISFSGAEDDGSVGGLIRVTTADGATFVTYCLEASTPVLKGSLYHDGALSSVPTLKDNPDAGKVNWILQHGYPKITADELGKLVGGKLSRNAAAGATQAAIWRITNHVTGVPWDPVGAKLADYLASHAVDTPEPAVPLSLSPDTVTGKAGSVLGPVTITSTGDPVGAFLDPEAVTAGVTLTDRAGNLLSDSHGALTRPAKSGDPLFLKAPAGAAPGSGTVTATASVPAPVGRALVSSNSQDLLLVGGDGQLRVSASAKVEWTAADTTPPPTGSPEDPSDPGSGGEPEDPGNTTEPEEPGTGGGTPAPSPSAAPSDSPRPSRTPEPTTTTSRAADAGPTSATDEPTGSATSSANGELARTGTSSTATAAAAAAIALCVGTALVLTGLARRRRH
ncbi:Cys-Gln thioester bond-forming surface protein [Kitasatospora sp. NPDC048722]|uniref:Cys-Gln thioester bond-forming surface protein n=1 Tax=Kitasatospora sp. NPDC048722 TaxID=3155639 RepID=UPI0033F8A1AC